MVEAGDRRSEALVGDNIASVCGRLGMAERGRESLESALALARELGFRLLEGHVLWSLGKAAELAGDARAAQRQHRKDRVRPLRSRSR